MNAPVMMDPGCYYIGDLCYVMHEEWDEMCGLFFKGRSDHGCNEGKMVLRSGVEFANFNTSYGDGTYMDNHGRRFGVDSGSIGCVLFSDLDLLDDRNYIRLGHMETFDRPFMVYKEEGRIIFGHIVIDTEAETGYLDEVEEELYEEE